MSFPARPGIAWILWTGLALLSTLAMRPFRGALDEAHIVLVYLMIILFGSALRGRLMGLALAVLSFLLFNFFLVAPYQTLAVADAPDWWILFAFLVTGAVAAELLHRAQRAAALAERRADEIAHLARDAERVEALRQADRMKDAVLASVSHDLRTPLTTIRALAAEMRVEGSEAGAIIEEEADRLNRLVTDLLDLSRIRAGALSVAPELNAADDLIGAALVQVGGMPGADRIEVRLSPDEALPVGSFDFVHALRALVNLLTNALRHTPVSDPVELHLVLENAFLCFEVHDRGPGVRVEDRERIFEPFYSGTADGGPAGTGLGLAIARSLAEAQAGSVSYAPREARGSIFTLRLPRAHLSADSPPAGP